MTQEQFLNRIIPLQPTMQLVAERLLGSADEAEDTVQEVVIALWERRDELDRVVNLEGYAMNALKHRCTDRLRRQRPTVPLEWAETMVDEARQEAELAEERAAMLDQMMARLPEVQRRAVQLRYLDLASHEQMQHTLHMTSANVYTTLSRAVASLRKMMARQNNP